MSVYQSDRLGRHDLRLIKSNTTIKQHQPSSVFSVKSLDEEDDERENMKIAAQQDTSRKYDCITHNAEKVVAKTHKDKGAKS